MGTHVKSSVDVDVGAILDAIRRIVAELRLGARAAEKQVGLSGAQLFVLHTLADAPALSLNELAERTHTHQSSVSVVVSRLVERGLVVRQRAEQDARRLVLSLTPAARALLRKAPHTPQQRLVEAVRRLPAASRARLADALAALVAELGGAEASAPMFFEDEAAGDARSRRGTGRKERRVVDGRA